MSGSWFNGHLYQYVPGVVSFEQAQDGAEALGGYLATVTSAEENQFLLTLMTNAEGEGGWLGGSDAADEGTWRWINGPETGEQFWQGGGSGVPLGYTNWHSDLSFTEPNDLGGEDYLVMYSDGSWNDGGAPLASDVAAGYFVEIGL